MPTESFEAMALMINGDTKRVQSLLGHRGMNSPLVYKWQERYDGMGGTGSGSRNPLDIIFEITRFALSNGTPPEKALAGITWLAEQFDHTIIPTPSVDGVELKALTEELIKTIKEFSELSQAASAALQDGKVTPSEARIIEKEGMELARQVLAFIQKTKDSVERK
ncbi:MAG: hypothetical protein H7843_09175 [Nitrospirota bacterium]